LEFLETRDILLFLELIDFGIKIITEYPELPFKPRKIARSSEKSPEKSWRLLEG
jgi:hypothetical protein